MIRLFGRKKPAADATAAPPGDDAAERRTGYSVDELAAAFPDAPPAEAGDAPAPPPLEAAPAHEPESPPPAAAGKPGWRERLRGSTFARSFGGLFSRNPKLDDDLLDEVETALLTADVGVAATTQLVEGLRGRGQAAVG